MRTLNNPRHERFAVLVAEGRSQADAYREVYPKSKRWKYDAVYPMASELARKVSVRVRELQAELAKRSAIEKEEVVRFLSAVVWTPVGQVGPDSPLVQAYKRGKYGLRISMVSKLGACKLLAELLGWYATPKEEGEFCFQPDQAMPARIGALLAGIRSGHFRAKMVEHGEDG
jgi:hypothetical protein